MCPEKKYSLISVDIADDEEVIHIGAPVGASASSAQKGISGNSAEFGKTSSGSDEGFARSATEASVELKQNAQKNSKFEGVSKSTEDSIQQTLEDLDAPVPFANMQKIVLVVLALVVVAFAIYWFTMHGV